MLFKQYMLSIMKDERKGFLANIVNSVLYFLSCIYGLAIKLIDWSYRIGLRRVYDVSKPVISVGNITLGGTGKTPFTIFLADHFRVNGKSCAVLTRGYGDDESRMLKDELPDIPIFIGQDRVRNARLAIASERDVIILDDGFQHRRIKRNLNIVLIDSINLFGNGFLFPRGILREDISSLKRADMLVLTKTDRIDRGKKDEIIQGLKRSAPEKMLVLARHQPSFFTDSAGAIYSLEDFRGKKAILMSGIVDPDYFAFLINSLGIHVVSHHAYPDHYRYRQDSLDKIFKEAYAKKVDAIITTKKDYVKLKSLDISSAEDKLFTLNITIEITEGRDIFFDRLNSSISN